MLGGTPVTMDTLLVLVTDGMALFAVMWKPFSTQRAIVGKMQVSSPEARYSGSKPSIHTTTVGRVGMV